MSHRPDEPIAEVLGVTKTFFPPPAPWRRLWGGTPRPPVRALRGVDLTVFAGEVLGVVGPNGAGKTVLMKLVSTLLEPTDGSVRVFGLDSVRDSRRIRARIGMTTTDERSFYWRLTCRQNLTFFARLLGHGPQSARRKIDELTGTLEIRDLVDRPYRELSAGNRQRLAIARALLPDPALLLLDEPTNSMDPIAAANLRAWITERLCGERRRAVVFTTHNLAEVEQLCARVAVLHRGRLLECAPLSELHARFGPVETVAVRCRTPVPDATLAALRERVPGLRCENGEAHGAREATLSFPPTDDGALDFVVSALVRAGARIVRCETHTRRFEQIFDRLIAADPGDGRD